MGNRIGMIVAIVLAWAAAWLINRGMGNSRYGALGLGLILLPLSLRLVGPVDLKVMIGSSILGLAVFLLSYRNRPSRDSEE